jgi:hypothetical protein
MNGDSSRDRLLVASARLASFSGETNSVSAAIYSSTNGDAIISPVDAYLKRSAVLAAFSWVAWALSNFEWPQYQDLAWDVPLGLTIALIEFRWGRLLPSGLKRRFARRTSPETLESLSRRPRYSNEDPSGLRPTRPGT